MGIYLNKITAYNKRLINYLIIKYILIENILKNHFNYSSSNYLSALTDKINWPGKPA